MLRPYNSACCRSEEMFWKKKPELSRVQSLDARALRNSGVRVVRDADGVATLYVPFRASGVVDTLCRWLRVPPSEAKFELDEVGTFVWDLCDGANPIREMVEQLSARYKLSRKEAEASLTIFLRNLVRRGLVLIVVPKEAGRSESNTTEGTADERG